MREICGARSMLECLNRNAAAIQAVGSVFAILVAIWVAWWQTHVSRRVQADARRRGARVLAMELLPVVKAMQEEVAGALALEWNNGSDSNIIALQNTRISTPDVLESALSRLVVFDEPTISEILGVLSAVREYHCIQSATNVLEVIQAVRGDELERRLRLLEEARRHVANAAKRLDIMANSKRSS
jgi:hypothetical protein